MRSRFVPALGLSLSLIASTAFGDPSGPAPENPFDLVREAAEGARARRTQPLSEVPAATISVITREEILAQGYETVADALAWVRGLYVSGDFVYRYVGVRGVQRPGDLNNKVLIAIDGHALNGNVYGDGLVGDESSIDLEAVERIEVIRGPGSALYGSYAVLAVVNIVTRGARPDGDFAFHGHASQDGRRYGHAALQRPFGSGGSVALRASWLGADGRDFRYPEFELEGLSDGWSRSSSRTRRVAAFSDVRWRGSRLVASIGERLQHDPTGSYGADLGDERNHSRDQRAFVEWSTSRTADDSRGSVRAYWDRADFEGRFVYTVDSTTSLVNVERGTGDIFGAEARVSFAASGSQVLTVGANAEYTARARVLSVDVGAGAPNSFTNPRGGRLGLYAQDEIRLGAAALTTLGARLDGAEGQQTVASPRADFVARVSEHTRWKALVGGAFRPPAPIEKSLEGAGQVANSALHAERAITFESSIEHSMPATTFILSGYRNRLRDLIDLVTIGADEALQFQNLGAAVTTGIEGEAQLRSSGGVSGRVTLAWQSSRTDPGDVRLTNSPEWNAQAVLTARPHGAPYALGLRARWLSRRLTRAGAWTAAPVVVDGRVGWRFGAAFDAGLSVHNVFDSVYGDPVGDYLLQDQIEAPRRNATLELDWAWGAQ